MVTGEEKPDMRNFVDRVSRMDGVEDAVGFEQEIEMSANISLDHERGFEECIG